MRLLASSLIAGFLALGSQAFAQPPIPDPVGELDDDQILGVVVEVKSNESLTIETTEVGDKLDVPENERITFNAKDARVIDDSSFDFVDVLGDLRVGDVVRLEFDAADRKRLRDLRKEEQEEIEAEQLQ